VIILSLLHPVKQIPVQVWTFSDSESVIRIGRSNDNQVVLYSAVVSRHHVELHRVGAGWEMINLGTNGTYFEGKRVSQGPVMDGAVIRLARSGPNLQIRLNESALDELSHNPMLARLSHSGQDVSHTTTEITTQTRPETAKPDIPKQALSAEN
jgi:pSer/pThr/pTyr-binding forkhead associated (FHA) protein